MIGQYEPLKTIGAGTFGSVKLARKRETSKLYAIKCICKNNILRSHMGDQIKMEIQAMKSLDHPHVVKIKEVLISPLNLYVVMQYLPGGELFTKITKSGKLKSVQARRYTGHLVDALSYCHSKFICHRDIKPQNIMLDAHDNAVFVDFGFAKIMTTEHTSQEEDTTNNHSGTHDVLESSRPEQLTPEAFVLESGRTRELSTICGTKPFMAPEILQHKKYQGDKADVWSLGVVVYVLLVGHLPFKSSDNERTAVSIPTHVSRASSDFIRKMLILDPSHRPSAASLLRHEWLDHVPARTIARDSSTSSDDCSSPTNQNTAENDQEKQSNSLREFTVPLGGRVAFNLKSQLIENGWRVQSMLDQGEMKASRVSSDGLVMVVITFQDDSIHVVKKNMDENIGKSHFLALKAMIHDLE
ncbi:serine-threonine kinase [Feldmannia irregularis virus a]|uniref:FirrV-1-B44 n=1 Tax=Feldmannia irregularis virus a TaxID=231992 RepID=Q6XLZ2_9PHYC|nr:serine-threonine kinase [Feldmannia irregularis virus a]AAR26919.1 FirrV-1-B44 [Feldmannia irregularis virus a]